MQNSAGKKGNGKYRFAFQIAARNKDGTKYKVRPESGFEKRGRKLNGRFKRAGLHPV